MGDPRHLHGLEPYAPRFGPSRGEEWALHGIITRAHSLVILSRSLRELAAQALPEELLHDLLPEIEAVHTLLQELHQELKEEIVTYRAAREPGCVHRLRDGPCSLCRPRPQDQELDGI